MKFIPKYAVMYQHERHVAGVEFDIDPKDADEMARHGVVKQNSVQEQEPTVQPPAKAAGRPRKNV